MKLYDNNMNRYCYDCFQSRETKPVAKEPAYISKARRMYRDGKMPSEIAKELGISAAKVYQALEKRKT